MKYRELVEKNTGGIPILYIDRKSEANNVFEEDRILWDPSEKGLALAEGSKLVIEDQKVVFDSQTSIASFNPFLPPH